MTNKNNSTFTNDEISKKYKRKEKDLREALRVYTIYETDIDDFIEMILDARDSLKSNFRSVRFDTLSNKDKIVLAKPACPNIRQILNLEDEERLFDPIKANELKEVLKRNNYIDKIINLLNGFTPYEIKEIIDENPETFKRLLIATEDMYDSIYFYRDI